MAMDASEVFDRAGRFLRCGASAGEAPPDLSACLMLSILHGGEQSIIGGVAVVWVYSLTQIFENIIENDLRFKKSNSVSYPSFL